MSERFDLSKLLVDPQIRIERHTEKSWAKLRVKRDKRSGEYYFDVLLGIKDRKDWHTHIGIDLGQSIRFTQYRDQAATLRRTDESMKKGVTYDNEITIDSSIKPKVKWTFKPNLNGVTGEVTVDEFKIEDLE